MADCDAAATRRVHEHERGAQLAQASTVSHQTDSHDTASTAEHASTSAKRGEQAGHSSTASTSIADWAAQLLCVAALCSAIVHYLLAARAGSLVSFSAASACSSSVSVSLLSLASRKPSALAVGVADERLLFVYEDEAALPATPASDSNGDESTLTDTHQHAHDMDEHSTAQRREGASE